MFRFNTLVLMVTLLAAGCATHYDDFDDRGYGAYEYEGDYVVDEVVYGGHSYGGNSFGLGYAHDPYWRNSAFSLFYQDFPSFYVWSPYRTHYAGFGPNFGFNNFGFNHFGFNDPFFGGFGRPRFGYDRFGFGHYSPIFGYTYRPRFSYFGFYSPRFYSPSYFYDYDRRDRRVVVRNRRAPGAAYEARRLTGNLRPNVFGQRRVGDQRLRAKDQGSIAAGNSRTASNSRFTRSVGGTTATRRSGNASRGTLRPTGQRAATQRSGAASRTNSVGRSGGSRNTRVVQPRTRSTVRPAQSNFRGASTNTRPQKIEQNGRSLVTRPQTSSRSRNGAAATSTRRAERSRSARLPTNVNRSRSRQTQRTPVATKPASNSGRTVQRTTIRPNSRATDRSAVRRTTRPVSTARTPVRSQSSQRQVRTSTRQVAPRQQQTRARSQTLRSAPQARSQARSQARPQARSQARSQTRSQTSSQSRSQPKSQSRQQRSAPSRSRSNSSARSGSRSRSRGGDNRRN